MNFMGRPSSARSLRAHPYDERDEGISTPKQAPSEAGAPVEGPNVGLSWVRVIRSPGSSVPQVLFICARGAARSVIAAALWERAGGRARAGGVNTTERIYPEVVEAMGEVGVDVTGAVPRAVTPPDIAWADLVVIIDCTSEVDAESTT